MISPHSKQFMAANQLEEMLPHLREIVNEIREGSIDAYATLYVARHRFGKIITNNSLGYGVPSRELPTHHWI